MYGSFQQALVSFSANLGALRGVSPQVIALDGSVLSSAAVPIRTRRPYLVMPSPPNPAAGLPNVTPMARIGPDLGPAITSFRKPQPMRFSEVG